MRRFFPSEPNEPANSKLFHILEQIWPIIREGSDSDEDCVRNIEMLVRITILLVDSGRLSFEAQ